MSFKGPASKHLDHMGRESFCGSTSAEVMARRTLKSCLCSRKGRLDSLNKLFSDEERPIAMSKQGPLPGSEALLMAAATIIGSSSLVEVLVDFHDEGQRSWNQAWDFEGPAGPGP